MAYVFVSTGSPPTKNSISVAVAELSRPANEYARIQIYCSNGTSQRVEGTFNGGTVGDYRSIVATFYGLSPDTPYTFRAEIQYNSTSTTENTGSITQRTLADDIPTVGNITGLTSYNVLLTSFSITWNPATSASSYQVEIKPQSSSSWSIYYTGSTSYSFSNLNEESYYDVRVRGYTGSITGSYSNITVRTQATPKPSALNWAIRTSGTNFNLTAKEWNDMTSKINAWRVYQKKSTLSFTVATTGDDLTATIFNQVVSGINTLNPPYSPAASVVKGEDVTAAKINRIGTSIDSLI